MNSKEIFDKSIRLAVKAGTSLVADEAQSNHNYESRTGDLERAVDMSFENSGSKGVVFLNSDIAPYAGFVHKGTAAHRIVPKDRLALRWVQGSAFVFAKSAKHPGYKGDDFLYRALDSKEDAILKEFDRYVDTAKDEIVAALVKG